MKLNNITVELKNIASLPNLIAEVWGKVDLGEHGKVSVCLCTVNKSDNFDRNPDGFWLPCTSQAGKKGRFSKVKLNGTHVAQFTDELKAEMIEAVKEKKMAAKKEKAVSHDWC